jgi:hypothetical protein
VLFWVKACLQRLLPAENSLADPCMLFSQVLCSGGVGIPPSMHIDINEHKLYWKLEVPANSPHMLRRLHCCYDVMLIVC